MTRRLKPRNLKCSSTLARNANTRLGDCLSNLKIEVFEGCGLIGALKSGEFSESDWETGRSHRRQTGDASPDGGRVAGDKPPLGSGGYKRIGASARGYERISATTPYSRLKWVLLAEQDLHH